MALFKAFKDDFFSVLVIVSTHSQFVRFGLLNIDEKKKRTERKARVRDFCE